MSSSRTPQNDRHLFMVKRNPVSARSAGSGPRARRPTAPGDGISEREKEHGQWGSAAADGSIPEPPSPVADGKGPRRQPVRQSRRN